MSQVRTRCIAVQRDSQIFPCPLHDPALHGRSNRRPRPTLHPRRERCLKKRRIVRSLLESHRALTRSRRDKEIDLKVKMWRFASSSSKACAASLLWSGEVLLNTKLGCPRSDPNLMFGTNIPVSPSR